MLIGQEPNRASLASTDLSMLEQRKSGAINQAATFIYKRNAEKLELESDFFGWMTALLFLTIFDKASHCFFQI